MTVVELPLADFGGLTVMYDDRCSRRGRGPWPSRRGRPRSCRRHRRARCSSCVPALVTSVWRRWLRAVVNWCSSTSIPSPARWLAATPTAAVMGHRVEVREGRMDEVLAETRGSR